MPKKAHLPPSVLPELKALTGLDPGQVDTILQLVSLAENGTTDYDEQHEYIEFLGDGRGYTCSLYGACSGTGDLLEVFDKLAELDSSHHLLAYHEPLRHCRGDNIKGVEPLGEKAKKDPRNLIPKLTAANGGKPDMAWRAAVWHVYIQMYWKWAKAFCAKERVDGDADARSRPGPVLTTPLALGVMLDTALNLGGDMDSFKPILRRMKPPHKSDASKSPFSDPAAATDERAYLRLFLEARRKLLKSGADDLDTSKTGDRCKLWLELLDAGNETFQRPFVHAHGYWDDYKGSQKERTIQ